VLILAAAGYGVTTLLNSSGSPASASGSGLVATPASTVAGGAPQRVSWLGMQIVMLPPGAAVIETVQLGSPGNAAGLEPGNVILQINNRPIHAAADIGAAISGLHAGDRVQMQISYGSALYQTEATLAGPPSIHP
jgi:S1-C subfamily serine protease